MDQFCSKCGSPLSSGSQFCASCGALSAAAVPVAAVSAPQAAPAQSSGNSAVKIILIILLIFVGLGILGAGAFGFAVWRAARALHLSSHGDQVTMSTPGGTVNLNTKQTYSASDLGTDIYPGAQPGRGGMKMDMPDGSMITAIYLTTDSKDQVLAFYKGRFGSDSSVFDTADGAVLTGNKGKQESVVVTITAKPNQNDGKTQIAIVHTKSNKAN
jgi:hypothetical protein